MKPLSRARLFRAIVAVLALSLLVTPAVLAADAPTIATPKTYRYQANVSIAIDDEAATGTGEGEFDLERQAFRLTVVTSVGTAQIRLQLILVDGRLYIYNDERQRWEYIDLNEGESPEGVPETTLPPLAIPAHPTATYVQNGTEQIDGATANRWRADGRYNVLLPLLSSRQFAGVFIEEQLTVEAAIGADNRYLHRLTITEDGTITDLGGPTSQTQRALSNTTYRFSEFDQPMTITAPPDAVPAPNGPPSALRAAETPLARAMQRAERGSIDAALAALIPPGLPVP